MLKIRVHCPLCAGEADWIYDLDTDQLHRGMIGCPGGCTAIQSISVNRISEDEAKAYLNEHRHPENKLDL